MVRYIICEAVAIAVMVGSAVAGISERFAAENFTPVFRVLPVSAAVVAVVLPIIFFGDPKRRNRPRRREAKKRAVDRHPRILAERADRFGTSQNL
jgi:hypothetical protein